MTALDLLKGKKVKVMTDAKVPVELIIDSVKQENHSEDVGPSNAENDWWPAQREWTTFPVKFTNGHSKTYSSISEIEVVE